MIDTTMEQHPVPQNVTTFQFRLIGDMTLKQFGYLAGGAILAYVSYKLPLPFFFTWPMTILFAVGGVGFAFVPIEERPMDIWVLSFLKNVYSPTLYVWEKSPAVAVLQPQPTARPYAPPVQATVAQQPRAPQPVQQAPAVSQPGAQSRADVVGRMYNQVRVQQTATPMGQAPHAAMPTMSQTHAPPPGNSPFSWLGSLFAPRPKIQPIAATMRTAAPVATPSVTGVHMDFSLPPTVSTQRTAPQHNIQDVQKQEEHLTEKMNQLKHELESKSMTDARILELQKQLTEVLTQKDKMEAEVNSLRRQMASPQVANPPPAQSRPIAPAAPQNAPHAPKQTTVKIITPESAVRAGLPRLTTFPNVVTGITKDGENTLLPGVLVTVKDKDGIPVRALKTNRLGQFAASTPLANGVYFVEIEDPRGRYVFDRVQITLNGSIVPALEIIAKSQKELSRAKLAQEIFGSNPT